MRYNEGSKGGVCDTTIRSVRRLHGESTSLTNDGGSQHGGM